MSRKHGCPTPKVSLQQNLGPFQDDYINAGLWKGGIARLDLTQNPGSWYNMADALEALVDGMGLDMA